MTGFTNGTDVLADVSALVGEMEDLGCEHSQHDEGGTRHGGGAAFYAQVIHGCEQRLAGEVYPICAKFEQWLRMPQPVVCVGCGTRFKTRQEFLVVLGPVGA
jgi:hypothetical protein